MITAALAGMPAAQHAITEAPLITIRNRPTIVQANRAISFAKVRVGRSATASTAIILEPEPVLDIHRLSLKRGRRWIYRECDLQLFTGITAILGPNGAGKTTLLEALLRPERLRADRIRLNGHVLSSRSRMNDYRALLGFMPQHWEYFSGFTAQESVEYVAWLKRVPSTRIQEAARVALDRVGLLPDANVSIRKMSGGMRQRVGLAEALVNEPTLVVLDEPTVGLDPAQRAVFRHTLKTAAAARAVCMSTHLIEDVRAIADRVLVVDNGTIVFAGSPLELAGLSGRSPHDPESLELGYLTVTSAESQSQ